MAEFGVEEAFAYIDAVKLVGVVKALEFVEVSGGTIYNKQKSNPVFAAAVSLALAEKGIRETMVENGLQDWDLFVECIDELEEKIEKFMSHFGKKSPKEPLSDEEVREMLEKSRFKRSGQKDGG